MSIEIKKLIEELVHQELEETNAVGGGGVSGTGGSPLGVNMKRQHKVLWAGDKDEKKQEKVSSVLKELVENVLDDMGLKKATKSVRVNMVGGSPIYMDRHDDSKKKTKDVMRKVSKNLHRKPYSHDPPRMGLGESTVKLLEGKIDDAIRAAEDNTYLQTFLQYLKTHNVLPKYVPWLSARGKQMARDYIQSDQGAGPQQKNLDAMLDFAEGHLSVVNRFEKMARLNRIPQEHKDISTFSGLFQLVRVVEKAEKEAAAAAQQRQAKNESAKYYEDATYLILEPKSTESSCVYGKGTQWCISATQSTNHFEEYAEKGARFLFLINKQTNDKDAIAFAGDVNEIEIYDAEDTLQARRYIQEKYPKPILEKLNEILQKEAGIQQAFSLVSFDDILNNPMLALDWNTFRNFAEKPDTAIKLIKKMVALPPESMTPDQQRLMNSRVRNAMENIIVSKDGLFNQQIIWDVIEIIKSNPGVYRLPNDKTNLLLVSRLSYAEGFHNPGLILPVVFYPTAIEDILKFYLENPKEHSEEIGKVFGFIDELQGIANTSFGENKIFPSGSKRTWTNYFNILHGPDPDRAATIQNTIRKLVYFGDKYNWNFRRAVLET